MPGTLAALKTRVLGYRTRDSEPRLHKEIRVGILRMTQPRRSDVATVNLAALRESEDTLDKARAIYEMWLMSIPRCFKQ